MRYRQQIASYLEYYAYLVRKTGLEAGSVLFPVMGVACTAMTLIGGTGTLACLLLPFLWDLVPAPLIFTLTMGCGTWTLFHLGTAAGDTSNKMQPIAPPFRHPVERLPAKKVLVRASQVPDIALQEILVRPTTATNETEPEQLLRPHL